MKFENRKTSDTPEIEFTAAVHARKLHFEEVPNPEVRFPGHAERESDWHTERENLPNEVREGTVYRDARVQLLIASETINKNTVFLNTFDKERVRTRLENRRQETAGQETESEIEHKEENE